MHKFLKNKFYKRSLYILIGFFFVLITYLDLSKSNTNDLLVHNDKIITNVSGRKLLDILEDKTAIIIITHDKSEASRIVDILLKLKVKDNFYIYNVKNEELVLEFNIDEEVIVKQKSTKEYDMILKKLGSYSEKYILKDSSGNMVDTGYTKIYTPMVMFIKNGNILFSHYIYDDSLTDEDLKEVYSKGLNLISMGNFS